MSFENPTPLKVGARGEILGWRVRVAGRVVLGVDVEGARYYWNEFNLVDDAGNVGTLAVEDGEEGPEWKLFQYIETVAPLAVNEARRKKIGDTVTVGGRAVAVTATGRSTVYHIEGEPPEGVERGDLADYLNADEGERMAVISWTGDEVEYYEGRDVPAATVAAAFGLSAGALASRGAAGAGSAAGAPRKKSVQSVVIVVIFFAVIALLIGIFASSKTAKSSAPAAPAAASRALPPPPVLATGARGTLGGTAYVLAGRATLEVTRVSGKQARTEYRLAGENGDAALLVHALNGAAGQWHLLRPVAPERAPLAAGFEAAAVRRGGLVRLGETPMNVTELFRLQVKTREGGDAAADPSASRGANASAGAGANSSASGSAGAGAGASAGGGGFWPQRVRYGFTASATGQWLLGRWDEFGIEFFEGGAVTEAEVLAAFGPGPEKAR